MKRISSLSKAQIARIAGNAGVPVVTAAAHITRTKAHVVKDSTATELLHAHRIIGAMLNVMTTEQKSKCAAKLEAEGISPDGMTRFHERLAVLKSAGAA